MHYNQLMLTSIRISGSMYWVYTSSLVQLIYVLSYNGLSGLSFKAVDIYTVKIIITGIDIIVLEYHNFGKETDFPV